MATHLDLEEQEQLDQLKAFWKKHGNLIVWTLVLALGLFGGFRWWQNHQAETAAKAGALYDELDRAAQAGDLDKATRVLGDLKEHFPSTAYMQQAGLLAAKLQFEKGQVEPAIATLNWVTEHAVETEYKTLARIRLAGVLLDQKKYDDALKQLAAAEGKEFAALVADRRGDVLLAQGKKDEAKAAYLQAWEAMDPALEYRNLIDAKLVALGAPPEADAAAKNAKGGAPSKP